MNKTAVFFALPAGMAFAGSKSFTVTLPETVNIGGATLNAATAKPNWTRSAGANMKVVIE